MLKKQRSVTSLSTADKNSSAMIKRKLLAEKSQQVVNEAEIL